MKIAVIGRGYVGSAMLEFFKDYAEVISYDIAQDKVYPKDEIDSADAVLVCVSTPMAKDGSCDVSNVEDAIAKIDNEHILIKSTIAPGTTDTLSKKYNKNICFSPEYIGESTYNNSIYKTMREVPFLIIGGKRSEVQYLFRLFEQIAGPETIYYECGSLDAELIKYMENSFLATKVTFVNEFYEIAKQFGADWHRVREGWLLDERIGRPFTSVFVNKRGFSGKCLPKDVNAITLAAKKAGYTPKLLEQILQTNDKIRERYNMPTLETSFLYNGKRIRCDWYDINDAKVPDYPWHQVYVIGNIDGKVPVVHYLNNDPDNLPGGKLEEGESVDEALRRELLEELNASVKSWAPVGYQIITEPNSAQKYQLRVYADLKVEGSFTEDPAGSISGYSLVDIDKLNNNINYDLIGDRIVEKVQAR